MTDSRAKPARDHDANVNTCTCGHPDREHSSCSGECYLCACKHYTPARKIEPRDNNLIARLYHLFSRARPATKPNGEQTGDKDTES